MGFMGDMFSSGKGAGFQAQGVNQGQLDTSYAQTQAGIKQQQDFVNALMNQGALNNQTSVFGQQQNLANQLQAQANGTGVNPALAQLNQTTGQNIANQAALMAGQRGSSANTGLMARQAAQQGGNLQQQAVGQAATLNAQQRLAALQQLQNQQTSMGNLANTQVNQMQAGLTGLNQNSLQQQANLMGLQANINSANAGIAGKNQESQGNMMGNMMGAIGSVGSLFGGSGSSIGSTASGFGDMAGGAGDAIGGASDLMIAAEGGIVPKKYADGGGVDANPLTPDPVAGAQQPQIVKTLDQPAVQGPSSRVGKMFDNQAQMPASAPSRGGGGNPLQGMEKMIKPAMEGLMKWGEHEAMPYLQDYFGGLFSGLGSVGAYSGTAMAGGAGDVIGGALAPETLTAAAEVAPAVLAAASGGKVPALLSPGERYLSPDKAKAAAEGKASPMKDGVKVPGKPKVAGAKNSYANDTVPAKLEEGGIVIPRSITQGKNAEERAIDFVRKCMAKSGNSMPKKSK